MHEAVKAIGGIAWVIGIVLFLVQPTIGAFVLVIALLLTVWSVQKTREQRHKELVQSVREGRP